MTRTRWMVAGLLAGGMWLGTGCSSTKSMQRDEPMEPAATTHAPSDNPDAHMPGSPASQTPPPNGGGSGGGNSSTGLYKGYNVPQEDRAGTGGSGYQDAVTDPDASDSSGSRDIRDQDPIEERGTGGSGYEKDSDLFDKNQQFGGSSFPGDKAVPQRL